MEMDETTFTALKRRMCELISQTTDPFALLGVLALGMSSMIGELRGRDRQVRALCLDAERAMDYSAFQPANLVALFAHKIVNALDGKE